jgi:hypothetical protein
VDDAAEVGGGCSGADSEESVAGSSPSMVSSGGGWERLRRLGRAPTVDDGAKSVVPAAAPAAVDLLWAPLLPWFRVVTAAVARSD